MVTMRHAVVVLGIIFLASGLHALESHTSFGVTHNSGNSSLTTYEFTEHLKYSVSSTKYTSITNTFLSKAEDITTGERYSQELRAVTVPRGWLNYGQIKYRKDELAGINNRYELEAGYNFKEAKIKYGTLEGDAGFLYRFENRLGDEDRQTPSLAGRIKYRVSIKDRVKLEQSISSNLDATDSTNYEMRFETKVSFTLTKRLSWFNAYKAEYRNRPGAGRNTTDHRLVAGLEISLGGDKK